MTQGAPDSPVRGTTGHYGFLNDEQRQQAARRQAWRPRHRSCQRARQDQGANDAAADDDEQDEG